MISKSRVLQFLVLLLAGACCLAAQSRRPEDLDVGKILVAPRGSLDPLFAKTVVLLVRYNEHGALGLMLNRQTKLPISHALSGVKGAEKDSDPVFVGGPVDLQTVFALVRAPHKPQGANDVFGDVYFLETKTALQNELRAPSGPKSLRIYVGYSGWGPNQLENEVREGRWYIFDRSEALAFDSNPATLWSRLVDKADFARRFKFTRLAPHSLPAKPIHARRNEVAKMSSLY